MVKKITPHKGGRTAWISGARATPETIHKIDQIKLRRGESLGDLIQRWVDAEYAEVEPDPTPPAIATEAAQREAAKEEVVIEASEIREAFRLRKGEGVET